MSHILSLVPHFFIWDRITWHWDLCHYPPGSLDCKRHAVSNISIYSSLNLYRPLPLHLFYSLRELQLLPLHQSNILHLFYSLNLLRLLPLQIFYSIPTTALLDDYDTKSILQVYLWVHPSLAACACLAAFASLSSSLLAALSVSVYLHILPSLRMRSTHVSIDLSICLHL